MGRKLKRLIYVSSLVFVSFTLASCGSGGGSSPIKSVLTVTFDPNYDGAEKTSVEVKRNTKVTEPEPPVHTDPKYSFMGWYKEKEGKTEYNFNSNVVADMTLYGKWEYQVTKYKITLDPNYEGAATYSMEIPEGKGLQPGDISTPKRENYKFAGWYYESECKTKFEGVEVTGPFTLYANWSLIEYTVTFDPQNGESSWSENVGSGTTIEEPKTPSKDGCIFNGWRESSTGAGDKFDFDAPIKSTKNLFGSWLELESKPDEIEGKVYSIANNGVIQDTTETLKASFFNNIEVPYLSIADGVKYYLNIYPNIYTYLFNVYSFNTTNYVTTITNGTNKSTCVIDYKKQIMTFDDYSAFLSMDKDQATPIDVGFTSGRDYFTEIKGNYSKPKYSFVIDLKYYHIPIYYYNNEGYLPMQIFNNILCQYCSIQIDDHIPTNNLTYINGNFFCGNASSEYQLSVNTKLRSDYGFKGFKKEYMEYCYNLNALTLNCRYGLTKRTSRYNGQEITYSQDAYDVMKEFKSDFLSTNTDLANQALSKIINIYYDDGGHTGYDSYGYNDLSQYEFDNGKEYFITGYTNLLLAIERSTYNGGLDPYHKTGDAYAIGYYEILNHGNNDTAFLTFDTFIDNSNIITYKNVNDSNYIYSVINMVKYVDKRLRNNDTNVKNLVIDLSVNTGGVVYDQFYISSWLCGGATSYTCNPRTGALSEVSYKADINDDGKFDNNDKIPSSVENIYVITSPSTFSCGNLLCTTLEDSISNVHFIGTNPGGGACYVQDGLQSGYGSTYQCSSINVTCRKGSTQDNLILNDDGVNKIEYSLDEPLDLETAALYYDRDAIYDRIHASI